MGDWYENGKFHHEDEPAVEHRVCHVMDFQVGDIVTVKPGTFNFENHGFRAGILAVRNNNARIVVIDASSELRRIYTHAYTIPDDIVGKVLNKVPFSQLVLVKRAEAVPVAYHCSQCTYTEVSSSTEICKWCK